MGRGTNAQICDSLRAVFAKYSSTYLAAAAERSGVQRAEWARFKAEPIEVGIKRVLERFGPREEGLGPEEQMAFARRFVMEHF